MSTTDLLLIAVLVSFLISIALNIYQNKKNNNTSETLSKNDLSDVEEKLEKKLDNVNTSVNEKMLNLNKDVTKEVSLAMTQFNERLRSFDKSLGFLKDSQDNFNKILGGVKQFGGTAEWGVKAIVSDSLPNSMFVENAKLKAED